MNSLLLWSTSRKLVLSPVGCHPRLPSICLVDAKMKGSRMIICVASSSITLVSPQIEDSSTV